MKLTAHKVDSVLSLNRFYSLISDSLTSGNVYLRHFCSSLDPLALFRHFCPLSLTGGFAFNASSRRHQQYFDPAGTNKQYVTSMGFCTLTDIKKRVKISFTYHLSFVITGDTYLMKVLRQVNPYHLRT